MSVDWLMQLKEPDYHWDLRNPGATDEEIAALETFCGCPLPLDYVAFLRISNGAALWYRDVWYMRLWSSRDAPSWSAAYGFTADVIPGAVAFGDDGGGEGLVFDIRPVSQEERYSIYAVNFVTVGWKEAIFVAKDFRSLLLLRASLFHTVQGADGQDSG